MKKLFYLFLLILLLGSVAGGTFLLWGYNRITRDLPRLSRIEDYNPPAVSVIYSSEGLPIGESYEERRYPARLSEVPVFVRNAFIAAEDASFYSHPGIDFVSIARAMVENIRAGRVKQGGSTITQQVVKNLLLSSEKKYERKLKEAILSYQIEQKLSKDDILEMYLNQIFFGSTAYGIKAAAWVYFRKELSELTLAEAAMLAGLPKAPSKYSPTRNFDEAKNRAKYVLGQMVNAGFVTRSAADQALKSEIKVYGPSGRSLNKAPYYVAEVRRVYEDIRRQIREKTGRDLALETDGLRIYSAVDLTANEMAERAVRRGLHEVTQRRGWRGPTKSQLTQEDYQKEFAKGIGESIEEGRVYHAWVSEIRGDSLSLKLGELDATLNLADAKWARKMINSDDEVRWSDPKREIRHGDVIQVSLVKGKEEQKSPILKVTLAQTPMVESGIVLIDPHSGQVKALVGGYDYNKSQFNRVTQSLRQPGSAFKPIVYLSAIDGFGYTPSTIVYDQEQTFRVGEDYWTPNNFDKKFMGPIPLRMALEKSRNLVSADIISRIGVDAPIRYARQLGITSRLGANLSLSLGSSEMTLLELTRAYGVFAAGGVLFESVFITRIEDRWGNVLYDIEQDPVFHARQAVNQNSAFIMAYMMKGVVERGTGYRVRSLGRPVAGKTGTSNDQMDAWFIGYTPEWACGVWSGFDVKKTIGEKETGGRVSAPTWLYFMKEFLDYRDTVKYQQLVEETKNEAELLGIEYVPPEPLEPLDFSVPDGVDPYWVNRYTGLLADPGDKDAIYEYFLRGTEPQQRLEEEGATSYLESPEL